MTHDLGPKPQITGGRALSDKQQTVDRLAQALGNLAKINKRFQTEEHIAKREEVLALLKQGLSNRKVADQVGLSHHKVEGIRRDYGKAAGVPTREQWLAKVRKHRPKRKRRGLTALERKQRGPSAPREIIHLPPPADAKPLEQIRLGECTYPYGERPYRFCGRKTASLEHSFCEGHEAVCYDRRATQESQERAQENLTHRPEAA